LRASPSRVTWAPASTQSEYTKWSEIGRKEKNGIEAWRRGSEGMRWQTAMKNQSGWTTSVWERKNGRDEEKKMGKREWRKMRREKIQRGTDRVEEETRVKKASARQWRRRNRREENILEKRRWKNIPDTAHRDTGTRT
jgi:hypothetical protein